METKLVKHTVCSHHNVRKEKTEILIDSLITPYDSNHPQEILKCCAHSVITGITVSGTRVNIDGNTEVSIIFLNDENRLSGISSTIPFSGSVDMGSEVAECEITPEVLDTNITAEIKGNAIAVKGGVNVCLYAKKAKKCEVVCDVEGAGMEQKVSTARLTSKIGKGEKKLIIEEELSIGPAQPSAECIIRHNLTAEIDETKIIGGKVMIKGTIRAYILYLPEEGVRPQSFEESFPFSQLIDVEGIEENCRPTACVGILFSEIIPRPDSDGELRTFSLTAKLAVTVEAYCEEELPIVCDAYSTKGCFTYDTEELPFKRLVCNISECFVARKSIEFSDGDVGSVVDMWCEVKNSSCRVEGDKVSVNGTIMANILAFDLAGEPACYERPVEFEYSHICSETTNNPEFTYDICISHCSYTMTGANTMAISVEPCIKGFLYDTEKRTVLTNITEDSDACTEVSPVGRITMYFADKGEEIWDIARRYNSSVAEIKALNGVTEDVLDKPCKFIIPSK